MCLKRLIAIRGEMVLLGGTSKSFHYFTLDWDSRFHMEILYDIFTAKTVMMWKVLFY